MPSPTPVRVSTAGADAGGGLGESGWDADSLTAADIARLTAWDAAEYEDEDAAEDGDGDGVWPGDVATREGGVLPLPESADGEGATVPVPEVLVGLTSRRRGTGGGFDAGGAADSIPPGAVLAGLAGDIWDTGLGQVSDDELAGLMIAFRRLASWASAGELAAVAELAHRRDTQALATADPHLAEHTASEVAMVLTLTGWSAGKLADRAEALARLPLTAAALRAGDIDMPKALVIIGELAGLDDPHATRVEAAVISAAPRLTTAELRRRLRRAVITADPQAARKRKENAQKDARVERWTENAGTAALAGRDLPPTDTIAADQRISNWARHLKAAGAEGTMDQLRAKVYLALLTGQPPQTLLTGRSNPPNTTAPPAEPTTPGPTAPPAEPTTPTAGYTATDGAGPAAARPVVRGSVNLVLPLSTWLGWSQTPGEAAGFGPLDAGDSRSLATALARDPTTTWCLTLTSPNGRALAHGCAKTSPGHPPPEPPPPASPASPTSSNHSTQQGHGPPPPATITHSHGPPLPPGRVRSWLAGITLAWLATTPCTHQRQTPGYRPTRSLAHLIHIRSQRCIAPGCGRPATACDFEHTTPYHQGGITCECNGGPVCRRHHRAKQAAGWLLTQPRPGTFTWQPPHGRIYTTHPEPYPA